MFKKPDNSGDPMGQPPQAPSPAQAKAAARPSESKPRNMPRPMSTSIPDPSNIGATIISADLTIIGDVISKGKVTLDGDIQGDMHCASLVVGENGDINGGIVANEVVVLGRVIGAIRGDKVMLQSTAHVEGDIFHQGIGIEMGAVFDGTLRRTENPTAAMATPDEVKARMKGKAPTSVQSGKPAVATSAQKTSS